MMTCCWFVTVSISISKRGMINAAAAAALVLMVLLRSATGTEEGCTEKLISYSACLPYVSYPPNNLTENASEKCCLAIEKESVCLCYLLLDPLILGFPLNATRLVSLPSICSTSTSFPLLCSSTVSSSSSALPPLNSAPTPNQTQGSSAANLLGAAVGRGGGGGSRGSSGSRVPIFPGRAGAGAGIHHPYSSDASSSSTLINNVIFISQFLATIFFLTFAS